MNRSLQVKIGLLLVVKLFIVAIFFFITYSNNTKTQISNDMVIHTNKVLYKSEKVLSVLKDVETATRGYIITGDESFLKPFYQSKDSISTSIAELKSLTKDNLAQQARIDSLSKLAIKRLELCNIMQAMRRANNYTEPNIIPKLHEGKGKMDSIRDINGRIQQEEFRLLAIRENENSNNIKKSQRDFFILLASLLVLLLTAFGAAQYFAWLRRRHGNMLVQTDSKLVFFSKRLDDVIKGIADPFFALDKNFNFIFANEAVQSGIGLGKKKIVGENFFTVFPQYESNIVGEKMKEVMATGRSASFETYEDFLDQWQDVNIYPTAEGISVYLKDANKRKAYEKELHNTQQFLEETNQVAMVGGWDVDFINNKVSWTSVTCLIHEVEPGYKPDLRKAMAFYKEGESRDKMVELVDQGIENGTGWDVELQIVTARGNERWVRTKGLVEKNASGAYRIYGTFQDIDEQKKMADELSLREQQFRSAFETTIIGMAVINLDQQSREVNQAFCNMSGYTKEDFLTMSFLDISHPDEVERDRTNVQQLREDPCKIFQYEKRFIHKDGHIFWVMVGFSAVTGSDGHVMYIVAQLEDITDKKTVTEQLTEEKKLLRTIIDNIPVNVYMKDLQSRKTLVNKSELKYSGFTTEEEVLGKTDLDLYPYDSAMISINEDKEVMSTGIPIIDKETSSIRHDNSESWFLSSKIPFTDEYKKVIGLIGISYDITERKKAGK